MTAITGTDRWTTVALRLKAAVAAELTVSPDRMANVPGNIAWDECTCGLLAVTLVRVYFSDEFPEVQATRTGGCDSIYEVGEFSVEVVRCAPAPVGQELSPTVASQELAAALLQQDMAETLNGLSRYLCSIADDDIENYLVGPGQSSGPEGDCVGIQVRVLVALGRY